MHCQGDGGMLTLSWLEPDVTNGGGEGVLDEGLSH